MIPFILDFTSVIYETFITRCVIPHHARIKGSGTLEVDNYYIRFQNLWQAFLLSFLYFFLNFTILIDNVTQLLYNKRV